MNIIKILLVIALLCYFIKKKSKLGIIILVIVGMIFGISSCNRRLEKRSKIKDLYNQATVAYESGSYIDAEDYLNQILNLKEDHKKANELITKVKPLAEKEKIKKMLSEIRILRDEGEYKEAYDISLQVLDLEPTNTEADKLRQELIGLVNQKEAAEKAEAERKAAEEKAAAEKAEAERKAAEEKAAAEKAAAEKEEAERRATELEEQRKKLEEIEQRKVKLQQETKQNYIKSCLQVSSQSLLRSPTSYKNKPVYISGTVSSIVEIQKGKLQSVLEATGLSSSENIEEVIITDSYGDIAILYSPDITGIRFLVGDDISVYGDMVDLTEITWTNIFGTETTQKMPQVNLRYYN